MTLVQLRRVKGLNYKDSAKLTVVLLHIPFLVEINSVIQGGDAEKLIRPYSKLHNKTLHIYDLYNLSCS